MRGESLFEQMINIIKRTPASFPSAGEPTGEEFESAEHENIGNKVKLRFPTSHPSPGFEEQEVLGAEERPLRLPNGLELTFGQIIALAGDFYGVPKHPIIDPSEKLEKVTSGRRERFLAAYSTLANANYKEIKMELDQILKIMTEERSELETALEFKEGKVTISDEDGNIRMVPSEVYERLGNSLTKKWDEVTGGKWVFGVPFIFVRMLKLAQNNYDHFLPFAKEAYLVGHELALEKAKKASKVGQLAQKKRLLEEAYSIDAFGCHFLTDSFSSGHLRTPRRELAKQVTPSNVGHLLCKYMHDEDNKYGLRVTNKRGDKWIAYGDGMLLNEESEENHRIAVAAVQASVDQVYEAFLHPEKATCSRRVSDFIPFVDPTEKNNYPMFQVKDGKLFRRADLENLSDPTTTSDWTGLGTVMQVLSYKPRESAIDEYDDDVDCRSCGQSLHPQLLSENTEWK